MSISRSLPSVISEMPGLLIEMDERTVIGSHEDAFVKETKMLFFMITSTTGSLIFLKQ